MDVKSGSVAFSAGLVAVYVLLSAEQSNELAWFDKA